MSNVIATIQNLTYEVPGRTLFENVNLTVKEKEHIGLVGKNGTGKSTLLKILNNQTKPTQGSVSTKTSTYYLPQIDIPLFQSEKTVAEYIELQHDDWARINAALHRWFKTSTIHLEKKLNILSGGEMIKLHLAMAQSRNPKLLLLDEPTNHLDVEGLLVLRDFLNSYSGAYVIVSHDPFFLDKTVSHIWEISGETIKEYGGNYSYYEQQKEIERKSQERSYEAARKELKKAHRAMQVEEKRSARSKREGRKQAHDRSMSAMEKGYFKNRASKTAGKQQEKLETIIQKKEEKVSSLKESKFRKVRMILKEGSHQGRRMLLEIEGGVLKIDNRLLMEDIHFRVEYGDRIALVGKNGSGKSSLAKALIGKNNSTSISGKINRADELNSIYLDQTYQVVNDKLTLIENVQEYNPSISHEEARKQLAHYLFRETDIGKKANVLSGGEVARLTLAMVTARPVDILILDEPTNNLDIETVDAIAGALRDFLGALIVISHNTHFLNYTEINSAFIINNKKINLMKSSPSNPEDFFNEMIQVIKSET